MKMSRAKRLLISGSLVGLVIIIFLLSQDQYWIDPLDAPALTEYGWVSLGIDTCLLFYNDRMIVSSLGIGPRNEYLVQINSDHFLFPQTGQTQYYYRRTKYDSFAKTSYYLLFVDGDGPILQGRYMQGGWTHCRK
jgi:hypothetical protein